MSELFQANNTKTITIVGLGLLGGSYAMGLKKAGNTVYGIDINENSIKFALENNYVDEAASKDFKKFLNTCDILVLCLYPNSMLSWLKEHVADINPKALITDVCGVKSTFIYEAQEILKPYGIEFFASHPMRGKEVIGIENADCAMFKDANLILCPTKENTIQGEQTVIALGKSLSFSIFPILSPEKHDEMIAFLSQLSHVIAVSLMTSKNTDNLVQYSGDSFRDLTRIANIDEHLWTELFIANKDLLCAEIDLFVNTLNRFKEHIKNEEKEEMKDIFRLSTKNRLAFNKKS